MAASKMGAVRAAVVGYGGAFGMGKYHAEMMNAAGMTTTAKSAPLSICLSARVKVVTRNPRRLATAGEPVRACVTCSPISTRPFGVFAPASSFTIKTGRP